MLFGDYMKLRNSKQRESILQALKNGQLHPTVDDVYSTVRENFPRISLATVYRNLDLLCRMGKIAKIESPGCPARYDYTITNHFHVKCRNCGKIADIDLEGKLEDYIDLQAVSRDFTVTGYRIDFFGLCPECNSDTDALEQGYGKKKVPAAENNKK